MRVPWEKTRREGWADFPFFSFFIFCARNFHFQISFQFQSRPLAAN